MNESPSVPATPALEPPTTWNISITGSLDGVVKAIAQRSDIPTLERVYLSTRVEGLRKKYNHVILNAWCHDNAGILDNHFSMKPSVQL